MLTNQIVCSSIILPEIKSRVMWICSLQGPAIERDGIQKKKAGGSPSNECVCVTSMRLNCLKGLGGHELTSFCAKIVCALERSYEKTLEIQNMKSTHRFCSALEMCIKICTGFIWFRLGSFVLKTINGGQLSVLNKIKQNKLLE